MSYEEAAKSFSGAYRENETALKCELPLRRYPRNLLADFARIKAKKLFPVRLSGTREEKWSEPRLSC